MKNRIIFALLALCAFYQAFAGPITSGYWVKVKIYREGVYKVTYTDLQQAGFPVSTLDPRNLQLRGHQGGMLPEFNGNRLTGLPEIPVWVSGESDGVLNTADYLLFYGGTTVKWNWSKSEGWTHRKNDFADVSYLYLGLGTSPGKRIVQRAAVTKTPLQVLNQADYLWFHDSDMVNPATMGRTWLGEKLGNETLKRNFQIGLPSGTPDSAFIRIVYGAGMIDAAGSFSAKVNAVKKTASCVPIQPEYLAFDPGEISGWFKASSGIFDIQLELSRPNTQSAAWLDYIELITARNLQYQNDPLLIRSGALQSGKCSRVDVTGGSALRIWGISSGYQPVEIPANIAGGIASFITDSLDIQKQFVAFEDAHCLGVVFEGKVNNADILAGAPIEMLIVAHPDFKAAAAKLAAYRNTHDGYSVKVVTPAEIYAEYSCGMQDIVAIRDYIRDEYKKSEANGKELKYVLLYGSGSYDFKDHLANNTNRIPLYEDYSTLKNATFCLDDFYGYLDSNMGRPAVDANKLKLAVGRIPARTVEEANGFADKLIRYDSPKCLGPWRTDLTFVCDDVDQSFEDIFVKESEQYAGSIANVHAEMQVNKVYADAYKQISNGNTELYPEVTDAITRNFNTGCLFMNYQGHGGERGWAQEQILTIPVIKSWSNNWNMPVLFTATCEFSRYDDPALQSAGEITLLNPNGGAIALMTTTRLVYVSGNSQINSDFWTNYGFPKSNEPVPTVGDIFKKMKNRPTVTSEDNKFALLGDPSMRLAFPVNRVVMDSINGKDADAFADTLKAFSVVRIKGHIDYRGGGKFSSFNGNLWVKVLDKPQTRYTLDNDRNNKKLPFKDQTSYIYKGQVSVANGEFSIVFSVPKDISYSVDYGKILLYAHNGETDANGAKSLKIGGSESGFLADDEGPSVKLYMNDTTFRDGGKVQPEATFLARIRDISGLNATGAGIGRDMIAILDKGSPGEKSFVVNEFFNYDLNSYQQGMVNFPMTGLSSGKHTIHFKVWDIHNNSAEGIVNFEVTGGDALVVRTHDVFPNPFNASEPVVFRFEHNKAGHTLDAELQVTDGSGRVIYTQNTQLPASTSTEIRLNWDGRSEGNSPLGAGFYLYQIVLKADDGSSTRIRGKMIKN